MSWIKEANKLGRFHDSYLGFRIYCKKEPSYTEKEELLEDGLYRVTEFTKGEYVAIDKTGMLVAGDYQNILAKIDKENIRRIVSKKFKIECEWK